MSSAYRHEEPGAAYFENEEQRLNDKEDSILEVYRTLEELDCLKYGLPKKLVDEQKRYWMLQLDLIDAERELLDETRKYTRDWKEDQFAENAILCALDHK